jgi:uncharacterized membrane protein YgdD (TMEM256/DUF423 family)
MPKKFLFIGSILGALAVIIGAFGAHALQEVLKSNDTVDTFNTASFYHLTHSILLVWIGYLYREKQQVLHYWLCISLITGILIFSGSLYILSVTGLKIMGAFAPIGGLFLIAAWIILAISALKKD